MTALLLFAALAVPPAGGAPARDAPLATGRAYLYRPGLFAVVAHNRGMALDWGADGFASTPRCDRVGWYVWATVAGRPVRLQQLDCSAPWDLPGQRRRGLVLEVNWQLAHDQGWAVYGGDAGAGSAPAVVWGYSPPAPEAAR